MPTMIILLFPLLAGISVGSEVVDRTNQTELTVSKCLRWKWYSWVSYYDINRDGKITVDDLNKARNYFSQLHNLTGEDKKIREGSFTQWWTWMILWNKTEITENQSVTLQSIAFLDDKQNYLEKIWNMSKLLVHCHDVDNDGYISKKEATSLLRTAVPKDNIQDEYFFDELHQKEIGIPLLQITYYWFTYFTKEDCYY